MEQQSMQTEHTQLHTAQEIIQSIKNAADIPNISPEKKQLLDQVSQKMIETVESYFSSIEKLSTQVPSPENTAPIITTEQAIQTPENQSYTLADLENMGIAAGKTFKTPLSEGGTTIRRVSIVEPGIIVLSNIDKTVYGILDELYTPDQYYELVKKVSSGLYVPESDIVTPAEPEVIMTTEPVRPGVASSQESHHKSLAELLGQTGFSNTDISVASETLPQQTDSVSADIMDTEKNFTKTIDQVVPIEIKQPVVLPVSLEQIINIENTLEKTRTHKPVFDFLMGALKNSWAVTMPTHVTIQAPVVAPQYTRTVTNPDQQNTAVYVPAVEQLLADDVNTATSNMTAGSLYTSTSSNKQDPLLMFTN